MKVLDQELADTIKVWPVVSKVSTFEAEQQYNKAVSTGENDDQMRHFIVNGF